DVFGQFFGHGLQLFVIHCFTHYITFGSGYR
ncbi:MAG: hypothetical protein ACI93R_003793, partial [Flavobacteriales bacterium]